MGRHAGGQTEIPHTDISPQADIKTQTDRQINRKIERKTYIKADR